MLYLSFLFLFTGMVSGGFPPKESDLSSMNLKGPIKQLVEHRYAGVWMNKKMKRGEWEETHIEYFNEQGYLTKRVIYTATDTLEDTYEYTHGLLTAINWQTQRQKAPRRIRYDFDSLRIYIEIGDHRGSKMMYIEQYDSAGKLLSVTTLDSTGKITEEQGYVYNELGQQIECRSKKGSNNYKTQYHYSKTGEVILEEDMDGTGRVISKTERTYDKLGNVLVSKYYDLEWKLAGATVYAKPKRFDHYKNYLTLMTYWIGHHVRGGLPNGAMIIEREIVYYRYK